MPKVPVRVSERSGGEVRKAALVAALELTRDMPDGNGKLSELDRIVAHADAVGDVRLGFDVRLELLDGPPDEPHPTPAQRTGA